MALMITGEYAVLRVLSAKPVERFFHFSYLHLFRQPSGAYAALIGFAGLEL